ncbi:type II toxin-antitoxin system RelE/ParE family toxin [Rhizobium straminoryzae]|uniref:Type II toxin-antitoxin system RelE/ParE family toxin n=1 Tax=Rhizobium straminoryzae TaxID=1387186 RepID=A0A549T236_9HYPH|nr:type II toxin-antitoxin system RelE/ParE family toxin [Rhizobium straminoryzae]
MKIVVLPEAREDLIRLRSFLLVRNPLAAQKAMLAIRGGFFRLRDTPKLGVEVEGRPGERQFFIPFGAGAYVLRYRLDEARDTLIVVRIWHGRESRD